MRNIHRIAIAGSVILLADAVVNLRKRFMEIPLQGR